MKGRQYVKQCVEVSNSEQFQIALTHLTSCIDLPKQPWVNLWRNPSDVPEFGAE
jgi:hypothetical protein